MRQRAGLAGAVLLSGAWGFLDGFFVTPWPAGFWLAAGAGVGCFLLAAAPVRGAGGGLAQALTIGGLHLALQPLLPVTLAHLHRAPGAAPVVATVFAALGLPAGVDAGGDLLLGSARGARSFAVTWELAALPFLARLAAAAAVVGGRACLLRNAATLVLYGAARGALLLAVQAGGARLALAYEPAVTLLSFLPLACLLRGGVAPRAGRVAPFAAAALALAGALFGFLHGHRDPGQLKGGRVLIDESRSEWERTDLPFDHARYGQRSLYNYGLWRSWIDLHYETRALGDPPEDRDLAAADILIIKTPTAPYDRPTVERIERFVRAGGGLYLIGDHTNLFGMSTVLNRIAAPYGIAFELDDTFPLDHEASDRFRPPALAPHPVLRGIDAYPFETSCTLRVPWSAEHLIIGRRLGAERVDYGHVNFFGNIKLDSSDLFGLFTQAAAVAHGDGRVAAFADSTNFSNFSLLWPGRRELTLNILDWLNRRTTRSARRSLLLAAGLAGAFLGGALLLRAGPTWRAASIWLAVAAFALTARAASASTARAFGAPPSRAAHRTVSFDTSLSSPGISEASPALSGPGGSWEMYNVFFINAARSGLWPRTTSDLARAVRDHDLVVVVNPRRRPSSAQMEGLARFLARGGRLLVLDSILNRRSTAALLVSPFGLAIEQQMKLVAGEGSAAVAPALSVSEGEGGRRRSLEGGGAVVWRDVGEGRVALAYDAALFSDRSFGGVYSTPTPEQERIYRGQADLLRIFLEPRGGGEGE